MPIKLNMDFGWMTVLTLTIVIGTFSFFAINTAIVGNSDNEGKGNCMLVYIRNIVEGTAKQGAVYQFPDGRLHVEPIKDTNGGNLKKFLPYQIGIVTGGAFNSIGLSQVNGLYNSAYYYVAKSIIWAIPAQTNENGTW